jgi:hypothetical protein
VYRFYHLIQNNPHLDGNQILQSVPPELRRFILDQLGEIEAAELLKTSSTERRSSIHQESPAESTDSEALRILEGLKKRENLVPRSSEHTKRRFNNLPSTTFDSIAKICNNF